MGSLEQYARRLGRLEKDVQALSTQPRLPYSSIDGGALQVKDIVTGEVTGIVGTQFDGTSTAASVGGTWPVAPTMPMVTEIVGGLRIYWDGTYVDGSPTRMDFRRVTFHAVTDVDLIDPLNPAQIVGEVTIATGGEVTVGLPYVEHFIYAITWTEAGKFSVESDVAFGTPQFVSTGDLDPAIGLGTDGNPPSTAPTVEGLPGFNSIHLTWTDVTNVDQTWYEIAASTTPGFTPVAGDVVGNLTGNMALIPATATTYVRVRALDPDGAGPWSTEISVTPREGVDQDTLDAAMADVATDLGTLAGTISGVQSDLTTVQTDLDTVEANLATANGELDTVQSTLTTVQADLDQAEIDLTDASKLTTGILPIARIAADSITATQIGPNAITTGELAANAVTAAKIAADTITAAEIAANAITANELAADSVTASKIVALTITGDKIAANTITAAKIAANTITANELAANTITAAKIAANTITANEIAANAITADELAANSVTSVKIVAGAITADKIAANAITAAQIAAGTITATEIDAAYVYTGQVMANQITTGSLDATVALVGELKTSGTDRQVSLSSADGLKASEISTGVVIAHIPTDPSQNIQLQADVVAKSVTALGPIAMRAATNEIAQAAALNLRTGTTSPASPPTASITWNSLGTVDTSGVAGLFRGGNYHAGSNRFYQAWTVYGSGGIQAFDGNTRALVQSINVHTSSIPRDCYGVFRYGNVIYAHVRSSDAVGFDGYTQWFIHRYDATTGAFLNSWQLGSDQFFGGNHIPTITVNNAGQLILVYSNPANGYVNISAYDRDAGSLLSSVDTPIFRGAGPVMSAYSGNADIGSERVWFTWDGNANVICWNGATNTRDTVREFPTAFGGSAGFIAYDTTRGYFVTHSRDNGLWYFYDGTDWTSESSVWYVTATWKDTDTTGGQHETVQGPPSTLTMKKRARLSISSPPIPSDANVANHDDPNAVRFYVGRGDGGRATQWLQASPADGVVTATIIKAVFSNADTLHPNPPATGDFPNLTPGIIKSDATDGNGPLFWVDGSGAGRWKARDPEMFAFSISGPWSGSTPGPTTGQAFTLTKACDVLITCSATAYTVNGAVGIFMPVYVDGVVQGQMQLAPTLTANVRLLLSPMSFKVSLAAGTHYVAFKANSGSSASDDTGTISIVAVPV